MSTLTFGTGSGLTGGQVGVPDLVGRTRAEAEEKLKALGLTPRVREIIADGVRDTVFSHEPPARAVRSKGSVVTLQVITPPPTTPDLEKKLDNLAAAVAKLETDAAAKTRHDALLRKLDQVTGPPPPASTGGSTSRSKA